MLAVLRQLARSEELKGMANKKFQENHFNEAIELYTSALDHNPLNHVLFANRAFCNIKLENYGAFLPQSPYMPISTPDCYSRDCDCACVCISVCVHGSPHLAHRARHAPRAC